jgi:hypothetical protein
MAITSLYLKTIALIMVLELSLAACATEAPSPYAALDRVAADTGYATTAGVTGAGLSAGNAPCAQPIPATPYKCR